jgi:hypothetical protein
MNLLNLKVNYFYFGTNIQLDNDFFYTQAIASKSGNLHFFTVRLINNSYIILKKNGKFFTDIEMITNLLRDCEVHEYKPNKFIINQNSFRFKDEKGFIFLRVYTLKGSIMISITLQDQKNN